jgi:hypothetical protein
MFAGVECCIESYRYPECTKQVMQFIVPILLLQCYLAVLLCRAKSDWKNSVYAGGVTGGFIAINFKRKYGRYLLC